MTGSGVSLQTTLAQTTSVAQTQLKEQQTHHATSPLSEKLDPSKDATIQHVRRPEKAEHERVKGDAERDRRRRDERRREAGAGGAEAPEPAATDEGAAPPDGVGGLIDTKA